MRISDWSSDVCSSDPGPGRHRAGDQDRNHRPEGMFDLPHQRRVAPLPGARRQALPALAVAAEDGLRIGQHAVGTAHSLTPRWNSAADCRPAPGSPPAPVLRRGRYSPWTFPPRSTACRSEEHTSELQSLMRISYAVFCLKKTEATIGQVHSQYY